ncbi:hypothetical protein [Tolypothrix sp. VBCCA 56010]|uniref:hypothetical protein n=1 Tax=Tolypothrix sp. VBCCA 56010 TaxID=3137731 RepID=UPI003D7DB2A0
METKLIKFSNKGLSATIVAALTTLVAVFPLPVKAITFVTDRTALKSNDQVDWSSLGETNPFNFLLNSFSATSQRGLSLNVDIPLPKAGVSAPFVFQTLPAPGIATDFASGDYILLTGAKPNPPLDGNPGPLSITFDKPVKSAGTQLAVAFDLNPYKAFVSAFDDANQELGTFSLDAVSSLALDNSAVFLGVSSDIANIKRLVFSSSVSNRPFGINKLSFAAVPEPSFTFGLIAFGAFGAVTLKRKLNTIK